MATIVPVPITRAGIAGALVPASVAGDEFACTGAEFIEIENGDAVPHTATLDIIPTVDGQPVTDRAVVIPAGARRIIGPFAPSVYRNPANGRAKVTLEAVTLVTIGVFSLAPQS